MGTQVTLQRTPATLETAAAALRGALTAKLGRAPNQFLFLILLATIWMETGAGKSIYHNNVGNVGVGSSGADYYMFTTNVNRFRVFSSLEEGMLGYLHEILRRKQMTQNAIEGRLYDYLVQYRDTAYCPDCNPDKLMPTFESLIKGFRAKGIEAGLPTEPWIFSALKSAAASTSNSLPALAVLAVAGLIFYGTVKGSKPRRA